jgi:pimeloyl-ACP methyl ester carboxylesterase
MCDRLGIEKPVVVGHSLGGEISPAFAASFPDLLAAVMAMDSTIVPSQERSGMMRSFIESLRTPAYPEELRRYFSKFFLPTDDQERKARILNRAPSTPQHQHVVASAWEDGLFAYDTAAAAAACRAPVLYIDAGIPNTDLVRFGELCPRLVVGKIVGSGHFVQLEVPEQVNAMIERFLKVTLRRKRSPS